MERVSIDADSGLQVVFSCFLSWTTIFNKMKPLLSGGRALVDDLLLDHGDDVDLAFIRRNLHKKRDTQHNCTHKDVKKPNRERTAWNRRGIWSYRTMSV